MRLRQIDGLKYELLEPVTLQTGITWRGPTLRLRDPLMGTLEAELAPDGRWDIFPPYKYDRPSGPTWDDRTNIGPALIHDVGYQALRTWGDKYFSRRAVDALMHHLLEANARRQRDMAVGLGKSSTWAKIRYGAQIARYWVWYRGLRRFAFYAAWRRSKERKYTAVEVML